MKPAPDRRGRSRHPSPAEVVATDPENQTVAFVQAGIWEVSVEWPPARAQAPLPEAHSACTKRDTVLSSPCCLIRRNQKMRGVPARRISSSEKGRCSMPTFMCFLNWTDQGAKAVKDAVARSEATNALIAGLGGRLVCGYVTTGQYDVVLVVEMPNGDAMTKLAVALTSRGNVRTTTVRAFSPQEFGSLAAEAP